MSASRQRKPQIKAMSRLVDIAYLGYPSSERQHAAVRYAEVQARRRPTVNRLPIRLALICLSLMLFTATACQPETEGDGGAADTADESAAEDSADGAAGDADAGGEGDLGTADNPIVMSFVPSGEMEDIVAGGDVVRDMLEAETGLEFDTNVATSYAAVIEAMGAGNAHIAWLPTMSYILAHERYGAEPILVVGRFGSTSYASQLLAKADSGIENVEDLAGLSFCRPDALSTSGWVVPSVMLAAAGVPEADLGEVIDVGGHDGVVTAVYNGDCDVGATWIDARGQIEEEYPDVMDTVSVIATSDDIPNDNVSVMPDLPEDISNVIRDGLVAIADTEEGLDALGTLYGVETLEPADDTFYDAFRVTLDASGLDVSELMQE